MQSRRKRDFKPQLLQLENRVVLSTTVDFEKLANNAAITTQYSSTGVNFSGTKILTKGQTLSASFPPHSGVNVVYNYNSNTIKATAAVGTSWSDVNAYVTGNAITTLTAYNAAGVVVGTSATGGANTVVKGAPNALLDVKGNGISYVKFVCNTISNTFTIDDFDFQVSPQITGVSFAKNSASDSRISNGDYDLNYKVSGSNLPNNSNLTLAVYWATGTTSASIIPGIPPVVTGQLQQAIGTYTFPVHTTQLLNPPAAAKNLIAVLDNNHVLPASNETNNVLALNATGAPGYLGYTWLDAPLSFELQSTLLGASDPAALAATREQRVFMWIKKNSEFIISASRKCNIDPVAVAGAIAWEALQNVSAFSARAVGPGKVHVFDNPPYVTSTTSPAAFIEGNNRYTPDIPASPITDSIGWRSSILKTPNGAIIYIAAIMNAYATEVEIANSTSSVGFPSIRQNPGVLAALYNGSTIHLQTAQTDLKAKLVRGEKAFSTSGTWMGQWVDYKYNQNYIRLALGLTAT